MLPVLHNLFLLSVSCFYHIIIYEFYNRLKFIISVVLFAPKVDYSRAYFYITFQLRMSLQKRQSLEHEKQRLRLENQILNQTLTDSKKGQLGAHGDG